MNEAHKEAATALVLAAGQIEVKGRRDAEATMIDRTGVVDYLRKTLAQSV